jgi:hypothetical protein
MAEEEEGVAVAVAAAAVDAALSTALLDDSAAATLTGFDLGIAYLGLKKSTKCPEHPSSCNAMLSKAWNRSRVASNVAWETRRICPQRATCPLSFGAGGNRWSYLEIQIGGRKSSRGAERRRDESRVLMGGKMEKRGAKQLPGCGAVTLSVLSSRVC